MKMKMKKFGKMSSIFEFSISELGYMKLFIKIWEKSFFSKFFPEKKGHTITEVSKGLMAVRFETEKRYHEKKYNSDAVHEAYWLNRWFELPTDMTYAQTVNNLATRLHNYPIILKCRVRVIQLLRKEERLLK